jgi:3-methyl-2-oxobutanoate hydroxymethyltransferase
MQDMLGITMEFKPRFLRRYADLQSVINKAVNDYLSDVKAKSFPSDKEKY